MLKTVYVKVPVFNKTKTDAPLWVIRAEALSNFQKVNNLNTIYAISKAVDYDPVERKYIIAIRFCV